MSETPKRGRKALPDADRRSVAIMVRFKGCDAESLRGEAESRGITVPALIRVTLGRAGLLSNAKHHSKQRKKTHG